MENYTPADSYSSVQIYETTDPVIGGTSGESNAPIKGLADRTNYLKNRMGGYDGIASITASGNITTAHANKLIVVKATTNVELNLADVTGFIPGQKIAIKVQLSGAGGPFWMNLISASNIENGSVVRTNIWVYDGEFIELVAEATVWNWVDARGNFDKIGEDDFVRIQPRNTLVADGTLGDLRAKYPRLWEVVSVDAVSDIAWTGNGLRYQALFSTGNDSTTFRRCDLRALSVRGLDLGRGISIGRMDAISGGYEADAMMAHYHSMFGTINIGGDIGTDDFVSTYEAGGGNSAYVMKKCSDVPTRGKTSGVKGVTTATENRIKTYGKIPVIYY